MYKKLRTWEHEENTAVSSADRQQGIRRYGDSSRDATVKEEKYVCHSSALTANKAPPASHMEIWYSAKVQRAKTLKWLRFQSEHLRKGKSQNEN